MPDRSRPPPRQRREAARQRQRRSRGHRRAGEVPYRLWLPQWEIIEGLIRSGRLTEAEALQPHLVEQALAAVVKDWTQRWRT